MTEPVSFTKDEVKMVTDFVNFVFNRGEWKLSTKESISLTNMISNMSKHIKKMEDYIFELENVVPAPEIKNNKGKK